MLQWPVQLALIAALLMAAGCDRNQPPPAASTTQPAVTIGYCAPEWGGAQFYIMEGLRQRAESRGWKVLVFNANFDPDTQARQIDYLISHQVRAIVCVPLHSQQIASSIARAHASGIPFFTIDRAPSQGRADLTVQADNVMAGRQAGQAMLQLLRQGKTEASGTVLVLQGELTQNVAQQRDEGFSRVFADQPHVRLIKRETHWQPHLFADQTEDVLEETPIDGIYLQSDMVGLSEVLTVLQRHDRLHRRGGSGHVFLVGVDGGPGALRAIRQGFMDCVASQPLTDYGIIVDWTARRLAGQSIEPGRVLNPAALWSPAELIDSPHGMQLQLSTTAVTIDNVDDPRLWGNQASPTSQPVD